MTSVVLIISHALLMMGVVVRVLLRRPARGVALAWLLLAVALPYLGALLYFLIGERRISRRRALRLANLQADFRRITAPHIAENAKLLRIEDIAQSQQPLQKAGESLFGVPVIAGNRIQLISDTLGNLRSIAADIDAARESVLMEFYIWSEGGLISDVRDALIRAAKRGVTCLVLIDAMGAGRWWSSEEPAALRGAGVELRAALPVGLLHGLTSRTDLRLHRKIVVIDGGTAWTGSMNMVDPRFFKQDAGVGKWIDAMLRIEGPVAGLLACVMISDWLAEGGDDLEEVLAKTRIRPVSPVAAAPVQVLASGPGETGDSLLQIMLCLITAAHREVIITTPYFVPEDALVLALRGAAARGVRVVLVLPRHIDSLLVRHASRSYFDEILEAGGEILQFDGGLLHTKSITVDGEVALFGTANFDMRSLWLNYEVSLMLYDKRSVADLRELQASYMAAAQPVPFVEWPERPLGARLLESAMRLVSPLL
ncbi:cardiolipin synthase [Aestuariivirga sp.]|jgi:cardiolipin synthase|uniref:cardiolipin synthase n=1 Tax=Aestuariivirga sp. TaxID=2650926 RepID=UPI003783DAFA